MWDSRAGRLRGAALAAGAKAAAVALAAVVISGGGLSGARGRRAGDGRGASCRRPWPPPARTAAVRQPSCCRSHAEFRVAPRPPPASPRGSPAGDAAGCAPPPSPKPHWPPLAALTPTPPRTPCHPAAGRDRVSAPSGVPPPTTAAAVWRAAARSAAPQPRSSATSGASHTRHPPARDEQRHPPPVDGCRRTHRVRGRKRDGCRGHGRPTSSAAANTGRRRGAGRRGGTHGGLAPLADVMERRCAPNVPGTGRVATAAAGPTHGWSVDRKEGWGVAAAAADERQGANGGGGGSASSGRPTAAVAAAAGDARGWTGRWMVAVRRCTAGRGCP
ncbi:hypothetical protein BU14_0333s0007 [Porphyra umbilicalis]|uniref:Uncharacterized protein n=1 Tax=Porphyra umbilicalis TaxID=2786 RepID=A0A1X6NYE5_PORUM|nr:hypothetical protein BU14_0333s0007 [Porphyra umbilicalis]|eukprot:OSX73618.1 hypothetical protein BU14_0333s0007 [Porphyra umbilicalis]